MNIENKVLAYLQWTEEATTEDVSEVIGGNAKGVYMALRRLALTGQINKRTKRNYTTKQIVAYWSIYMGAANDEAIEYQPTSTGGI